jgi:hypothetical protein
MLLMIDKIISFPSVKEHNIEKCRGLPMMNINKDILAFYWLRFVMWFYFIFHGMTTKSSKEVIIYHVILHWPVDIDRLKKLKWRPINLVSIEIWNKWSEHA